MARGAKEGEEMLLLEGLRRRRETRRGFELRVLINKKPLALTNRDIDGTEKGELRQWTSAGTSADVIFTQPSLSLSLLLPLLSHSFRLSFGKFNLRTANSVSSPF